MNIGNCCFCGEECNPASQSCGRCSRTLTGFSLGWNPLPDHLHHVYPKIYPNTKPNSSKNKDEHNRRNNTNNKHDKPNT